MYILISMKKYSLLIQLTDAKAKHPNQRQMAGFTRASAASS